MFRSMMLTLALGCFAAGCVAEGDASNTDTEAVAQETGGGFACGNVINVGVSCVGQILVLPIKVDIKDIDVLSNNDLDILEGGLNDVAVLSNILNISKILNDVEVAVLNKVLNDLDLDITDNEVDVCTTVLGGLLCK